MEQIIEIFKKKCDIKSDINEHLPILKSYGEQCKHITEMGVRGVVSTWAFLASKPEKFTCLDIAPCNISLAQRLAEENNIEFKFILGDSTQIVIDPTDLLFIDTHHTYEHLYKELFLNGNKASKFIIMHDTSKGGVDPKLKNLSKGDAMFKAIQEFIEENPHWSLLKRYTNNYGLTILKRS